VGILKRFNIANYNFLNTYTIDDWSNAISDRLMFSMKANYHERNPTRDQNDLEWNDKYDKMRVEFWEGISVNPQLQRKTFKRLDLSDHPLTLMYNDYPEMVSGIVTTLKFNDLMHMFKGNELSDFANDKIQQDEAALTSLDDYLEGDYTAHNTELEIYKKYNRVLARDDTDDAYVSIDLSASNEQILDSLSHWLNDQRKSAPKVRLNRVTKKDFDDWIIAKIVPYFDLINLALLDGTRISNHKIGDLLFPDEVDVDVAERVRKVTQPKANKVFHIDTVQIMDAQIQNPINTEAKI